MESFFLYGCDIEYERAYDKSEVEFSFTRMHTYTTHRNQQLFPYNLPYNIENRKQHNNFVVGIVTDVFVVYTIYVIVHIF